MLTFYPHSGLARTTTAAALCILLLAGCASPEPAVDAGPSASRSASPSASPTEPSSNTPGAASGASIEPSAPAMSLENPRSWIVDFATLGPLTLGTRVSEVGTSMDAFTATVNEGCPWITEYDRPDFPSIWLIASPESDIISEIVLRTAVADPSETGSSATGSTPSTREGIVLGSPLEQLTAAYPTLEEIEGPPGEPSYAVTDDGLNWVNFAVTDAGVVGTIVVSGQPRMPQEYCS